MTEEEAREPRTAGEVDSALDEVYGELLDANTELIQNTRYTIKGLSDLKDLYLDQAARCDEAIELHIRGTQIVSSTFGDILSNELGFTEDVESDGQSEQGS